MREFFYNLRNSEFFQSKKNLIILAVLILALPVGIFLLKNQQIFKSRATVDPIEFIGNNVERRGNNWVALRADQPIVLRLTTTLGTTPTPAPSQSPVASPPVASPSTEAPPPPTNVSATCPDPGNLVTFEWTDNNSGNTRYYAVYAFDLTNNPTVNWDPQTNPCGNANRPICSRFNKVAGSLSYSADVSNQTTPGHRYQWFIFSHASDSVLSDAASFDSTFTCGGTTWSANLLDPANMQNVTVSDPVTQKVQWFNPGTYTFTGRITSNTPRVQGNPTFASLQADEWTDAGAFSGVHSPGTTFTVPSGSKVAVILRAINADANFADVSMTKEEEGGNLVDPSLVNSTATATRGVARQDPPLSQKYRLYGTVSGDGSLDVAEWTSSNQWVASYNVNSGPFGITAAGNFLQAAYNVTRGSSATFSNVRWVGITQSANLMDSDKRNTSVTDQITQRTQEFGLGTYRLTGDITSNNPIVQGNPTLASLQADEWNEAGTSFIGVHEPGSTFTVPSGNKVIVILRAINANATFANVSLQKQQ